MIRFDHVAKRYPTGHEGLSGVDLYLEAGEMAFLTGHSGAGKSTLLKLIGLLERATRGQVWVNERNLNKLRARDIPYHRREVGMIFQDHRLLHDRTVFDNIALPLVVAAFPFGIVFGAMAHSGGLDFAVTLGMSAIVFAGASQFIAITLLFAASAMPVIVLTVFVVNLRQMLYSANLMHHVAHWPQRWRFPLAFWLTDETFAAVTDRINRHPEQPGLDRD